MCASKGLHGHCGKVLSGVAFSCAVVGVTHFKRAEDKMTYKW